MIPRGEVGLIFASIGASLLAPDGHRVVSPATYSAVVIMVIGLIDDVHRISPRVKIGGQLLAAAALASERVGDQMLGARLVQETMVQVNFLWPDAGLALPATVAYVLGGLGDARAVEPLVAALKDRECKVREKAVWALGDLGDARAAEPLIAIVTPPPKLSS
jgi:hypothetical protein